MDEQTLHTDHNDHNYCVVESANGVLQGNEDAVLDVPAALLSNVGPPVTGVQSSGEDQSTPVTCNGVGNRCQGTLSPFSRPSGLTQGHQMTGGNAKLKKRQAVPDHPGQATKTRKTASGVVPTPMVEDGRRG
jgi:hypothetical protein